MKKTVIWLDNYLEEFFYGDKPDPDDSDHGDPGVFQICTRLSAVLVGGDYPLPVCMVGIFERQLLHKKMYFH